MRIGSSLRETVRFGYAVGRVRALEGRLLSNTTLERLQDAKSFEEQKRILADTEYGSVLEGAETATDVERALDAYLGELLAFVDTARLPNEVTRFLRCPYDYQNMMARLKAEALGIPIEGLLSEHGTVDPAAFGGPIELIPQPFRDLDAAVRDSNGDIDADLISGTVDAALFADLSAAAESSKIGLLVTVTRLAIDLANTKTLMRSRAMGLPAQEMRDSLFPGGTVEPDAMASLYSLPLAEIAEKLSRKAFTRGFTGDELAQVGRLDVIGDELMLHHARLARLSATGSAPVIGYVVTRRSEIVIVRTLLLGVIAGMGSETLRHRVRNLYG